MNELQYVKSTYAQVLEMDAFRKALSSNPKLKSAIDLLTKELNSISEFSTTTAISVERVLCSFKLIWKVEDDTDDAPSIHRMLLQAARQEYISQAKMVAAEALLAQPDEKPNDDYEPEKDLVKSMLQFIIAGLNISAQLNAPVDDAVLKYMRKLSEATTAYVALGTYANIFGAIEDPKAVPEIPQDGTEETAIHDEVMDGIDLPLDDEEIEL